MKFNIKIILHYQIWWLNKSTRNTTFHSVGSPECEPVTYTIINAIIIYNIKHIICKIENYLLINKNLIIKNIEYFYN